MKNVMMISRHRQWRAWQFGRRHSGLLSGGCSPDDNTPPPPMWFMVLFVSVCVVTTVLLIARPKVGVNVLCVLMLIAGVAMLAGLVRSLFR